MSTATHQTHLDFSLLGETELWSRLLDLLHQLSSTANHQRFSVENLQRTSDQNPWLVPERSVRRDYEVQPQSGASVYPSKASLGSEMSYAHQIPQTSPIKRGVKKAAISRLRSLRPSPESPATRNARSRNYSARNAKRKQPSSSATAVSTKLVMWVISSSARCRHQQMTGCFLGGVQGSLLTTFSTA